MPITYSPLRYPGGKTQIAPFVEELIKKNNLFGGVYVEPFAGGAGIAWHLLLNNIVEKVIINDLSPSIFSFWNAVLFETDYLCELIVNTPVTIDEWYKQKEIQNRQEVGVLLGFSTFFLNRVNRSGIINAGVIGGKAQSGKYKLDCRYNKSNLIKKIESIAKMSSQVKLSNMDASKFLETEAPSLTNNALINIDPPYFNKGKELYQNFYDEKDHHELFKVIRGLSHPWMVTYDNTPEINHIYYDYNPRPFSLNYSAQTKRKGAELLIMSPNLCSEGIFERLLA